MMHAHEKSDLVIVAMKRTNKAKQAYCGGICGGGRSGAGGAKGEGQGECGPAKHAPDAVSGKCVTGRLVTFVFCHCRANLRQPGGTRKCRNCGEAKWNLVCVGALQNLLCLKKIENRTSRQAVREPQSIHVPPINQQAPPSIPANAKKIFIC
jgi:hypothetical protein